MIRINLLAVERERVKRKAKFQVGQKVTVACSLILVAAALFVAWKYWALGNESTKLDEDIRAAETERTRLNSIIQQVQQFDARKAQLQERVVLIEQLRKGQTAAVHMVDEVSRALPEMLWLTDLTQKGGDVTISGQCTTLTALSDFVANLSKSAYFKGGVEIVDSQVQAAQAQQGAAAELIRFSVKAQFAQP